MPKDMNSYSRREMTIKINKSNC
jgi:hypothetical protein